MTQVFAGLFFALVIAGIFRLDLVRVEEQRLRAVRVRSEPRRLDRAA